MNGRRFLLTGKETLRHETYLVGRNKNLVNIFRSHEEWSLPEVLSGKFSIALCGGDEARGVRGDRFIE